jgi:hypothetical protein
MTSQLNVDTIVDKAGTGGVSLTQSPSLTTPSLTGMSNTSTYTSEGGAVTQNTVQGLAKTWVNFNGTSTVAIRDSLNVSGLTDNGTGDQTVHIGNDMSNVNYSLSVTSNNVQTAIGDATNWSKTDPTVALYRIITRGAGSSYQDSQFVCCEVQGDLA